MFDGGEAGRVPATSHIPPCVSLAESASSFIAMLHFKCNFIYFTRKAPVVGGGLVLVLIS